MRSEQADFLGRIPDQLSFVDAGPILCAGVTTYKGLKETDARPGEWVVISGVGGLGHVAIQYATAMGFHVAAVDVGEEKLDLARKLGAEITVDASAQIQRAKFRMKSAELTVFSSQLSRPSHSSKPSACFVAAAHAS